MILCYKFSFACLALTHHVIDSQQGHGHLDSGPVFRSLEDGVGVGGKQLGPEGGLQGAGVGRWGPGALGGDEEGEAEYCNGVEKDPLITIIFTMEIKEPKFSYCFS